MLAQTLLMLSFAQANSGEYEEALRQFPWRRSACRGGQASRS